MSKATTLRHKPHFFKIILPGSLQQLSIPEAFIRDYLQGQKRETKATLRTCRSSKSWVVGVNKSGCFTTGWEDFATQLDLHVGDFLVFKHEGSFVFHVVVFDPTACERTYPWQEDVSANNATSKRVEDDPPSFSTVLRPCGITRGCLAIPGKFSRENGVVKKIEMITLKDWEGMSWKAKVRCYVRHRCVGPTVTIGSGWRKFIDAHQLKAGDVCTFKLVSRKSKKAVMEVSISRSKS